MAKKKEIINIPIPDDELLEKPVRRMLGEEVRDRAIAELTQKMGDGVIEPNSNSAILNKLAPVYRLAFKRGYNPQYTADELMVEVSAYFDYAEASGLKPTRAGLCMWLGIGKNTYNEWTNGRREDLLPIVQVANQMMETYLQNDLDEHTKGAMFLLKCTNDYKESTQVDISTNRVVDDKEVDELVKKLGFGKENENE